MSFDRTLDEAALFRICFVCTGNICRSPMAETVFKSLVKKAGLESKVAVISAGTGDWHVGESSDERTLAGCGRPATRRRVPSFATRSSNPSLSRSNGSTFPCPGPPPPAWPRRSYGRRRGAAMGDRDC